MFLIKNSPFYIVRRLRRQKAFVSNGREKKVLKRREQERGKSIRNGNLWQQIFYPPSPSIFTFFLPLFLFQPIKLLIFSLLICLFFYNEKNFAFNKEFQGAKSMQKKKILCNLEDVTRFVVSYNLWRRKMIRNVSLSEKLLKYFCNIFSSRDKVTHQDTTLEGIIKICGSL